VEERPGKVNYFIGNDAGRWYDFVVFPLRA
jgi:hypothetical protein